MVELTSIEKRYGDFFALKPITLSILKGQVTALIGPSGCGKSTLLRIILGLIQPDSGTVEIDGEQFSLEKSIKLRRQIGYVVQDGGLFPHLSAKENICLMMKTLETPNEEIENRIKELCDLTHIDSKLLSRFPGELSGGQRQRVGLMRALALKPKLLLLDEPLGALDPLIRAGLQSDLKQIFSSGDQTVVFVTHDMGEAAYLGNRIVLLSAGEIVQQGSLAQFKDQPATPFVTEFLNAQRQIGALA